MSPCQQFLALWNCGLVRSSCFRRTCLAPVSLSPLTSSDVVPHGCSPYDYDFKWYASLFLLLRSCSWSDVISDFITFKLSDMQPFFRAWDFSACKISASGILQGHGTALARIIFKDFGVQWLLIQILVPPKVKNYPAISCLKCLLLALNKAA